MLRNIGENYRQRFLVRALDARGTISLAIWLSLPP
jgi:hypothetical protein